MDTIIPYGVERIGMYAFSGCNNFESITIPDSVTMIGIDAFNECSSLKNVTFPNSVTSMGSEVFGCCYNLKRIYFKGTEKEWKDISSRLSGLSNDALSRVTIYYYSETQPTFGGNYWHYDNSGNVVVWGKY